MTLDINPCIKIIAKEYWHNKVLVCPCVTLYMLFDNREVLKAIHNDEVILWEVVGTREWPDINTPEGDESFFFPFTDHTPIDMPNLGDLISYHVIDRNTLKLNFRKNVLITLSISPETQDTIEVKVT